ncbi:MAG: hypothetical protein II843_01855, partial [Alphaproteobacteria bacterium]|nr:hypothetical protein [Alphaproteobacteria bacterium]
MSDIVNVCFICDSKYTVPTGVAIQSLLINSYKKTKYNIYIIGVNLDKETVRKFNKLKSHNHNIFVINTDNKYEKMDVNHGYVSKAALIKFDLPNILSNLDKILYLDSDI